MNFITGLVFGLILGFGLAYRAGRDIQDLLDFAHEWRESRAEQPTEPHVTRGRAFTNENMPGQENSSIVVPKTPQQIAWEEQEELRKLNLR